MKIRVTTDKHEYQGLFKGSEHDATCISDTNTACCASAAFSSRGKFWTLRREDFELVEDVATDTVAGPIKSDGGSSSYYDLTIPDWLVKTLTERQAKEYKCYIKTEEIIAAFLSNDFDYGNLFKSMIRCKGLQDGTGGKAGNSVEYECNKMAYSVNKIKEKKIGD